MSRKVLKAVFACGFLFSLNWPAVMGQASGASRVYRGSIGNRHIQMRLNFTGKEVTGTYFYDDFGQDLQLTGRLDERRLELKEFAVKGKQSGKFVCKKFGDPVDSDCTWSKADGSRESFMTLVENHMAFTNGLQVVPKTLNIRKTGVGVSYPQLTGNASLSAASQNFNRRILDLVKKRIAEFSPIDEGKGVFDTTYDLLLGTNDLVSIEMAEYYDGGGAHPDNSFWSITYDLAANKELTLDDLFKPGSDYKAAIARYAVSDIDKRYDALEQENARSEGRKPNPRENHFVSEEQLSELSGWAMTPRGLMIYVDFPHVMAFFDKTFIPYSAVGEHLKPNGPVSRIPKT